MDYSSNKIPQKFKIKGRVFGSKPKSNRKLKENLRDLSELEDSPERIQVLRRLARSAGRNAFRKARRAGISTVYVRNHKSIELIHPDGTRETIQPLRSGKFYFRYKPNTILHVAKK